MQDQCLHQRHSPRGIMEDDEKAIEEEDLPEWRREEDLPEWRIRLEFNHLDLERSNPEGAFMDVRVNAHTADAAAWLAQVMHCGPGTRGRELAGHGNYVRIVIATRAWSQSGVEVTLDYDKLARWGWTE